MPNTAVEVTTFSEARANLKSVFDRATRDHQPVVVSRRRGESVVIMSLNDWNGWLETMYLNSTAENRLTLDESMAQAERGDVVVTELDPDGNWRPVDSKRS